VYRRFYGNNMNLCIISLRRTFNGNDILSDVRTSKVSEIGCDARY
jgi:hypothetical protein